MNIKSFTLDDLLRRLADGWPPERNEFAAEFFNRWLACLHAAGEIEASGENWLQGKLDLSAIRLHGSDNVAVLLVGGGGDSVERAAWDFWHRVNSTDRLVFFLLLSEAAEAQVKAKLPKVRCVWLSVEQIRKVAQSIQAGDRLKELIRSQLPLHQLLPYHITSPVNQHMFFGRAYELDRLLYEPETSFAIAGPGRLGKTSLGLRFHKQLVLDQDPRASRCYRIDFYDCQETTNDGVAKFLAMKIEPSHRSSRVGASDLINFLRYQQGRQGGPLELLLDELDEVIHLSAFEMLAMAARQQLCRLVLCGRGNLLKAMTSEGSPLKSRIELIRLKPLDEVSARRLIVEPLADLGFKLEQPERLIELIFHWTGRLPHLMQYYCKRLVNLTRSQGSDTIKSALVDIVRSEFETVQLFADQLESVTDTPARMVALHLLRQSDRFFTAQDVQRIVAQKGLPIDMRRTLQICDELVIHNVLAWHEEAFCIANHSLAHYVRKMRLQDNAFVPDGTLETV